MNRPWHSGRTLIDPRSTVETFALACLVAGGCFAAARVGGEFVLRPLTVWPLWPGCAFLAATLLMSARRIWPMLLTAGLAGFVIYDLPSGLPVRAIALLLISDAIEVLVVAFGVRYFLGDVTRLDSVASLAKYCLFALILGPLSAAFLGATALGGTYWVAWRISLLTEALALLTITPAILCWVNVLLEWPRSRRPARYIEVGALLVGLVVLGYFSLVGPSGSSSPAVLYGLVPFLLWSALRFGIIGTSSSMIIVAFLSMWGVVHERGPFTGRAELEDVWSLQLFLLLAATSFMVLAAVAEDRRQAVRKLQESEKRFRLAANTAPVLIWMSDTDARCDYFNKSWLNFTGRSIEEELGNGWTDGVHPDDVQECVNIYMRSFERRSKFKMEYRLRRHDGVYRWIVDIGVPRFNEDGSFAGYIGVGIDITERKAAEEVLSGVSRRLIQAQEQERRRIARDLHDDIAQRLALYAIQLEELRNACPESMLELSSHMGDLQKQIVELSMSVQAMSHELHSSKLEYLGLATTMKSFCIEFAELKKVQIYFQSHNVPSPLTPEIALSLFRVLQESLHNASKHSGAKEFYVHLWGTSAALHLKVKDLGVGFDLADASKSAGLGLTSMRERLRLLNGDLLIDSKPNIGTTIHARVPLTAIADSALAAG